MGPLAAVYLPVATGYERGVTGIARLLTKILAGVLLTLCVASPAIAEIGCSWDAATHFGEIAEHDRAEDADSPDPGGARGGGESDRDSHCAFSHGHGTLAPARADPTMPARELDFVPPLATRFVSSLPPGLDRPPRG